MNNKSLKKSTIQQLQKLVEFMEENPEFAKGTLVFGENKFSMKEKWTTICQELNSHGPPTRTIAEWKKTWADLKSRTKKKISENKKSMQETGGGLYRFSYLTELEEVIDRTLMLSSARALGGKAFGDTVQIVTTNSIDDCFQSFVETPPRSAKAVAMITPSRLKEKSIECNSKPSAKQPPQKPQKNRTRRENDSDDIQPACSSAKKRRSVVDEQLTLIRRHLRVAERNAASSAQQADAMKRLAAAAELHAESAKRQADAAETQAACMQTLLSVTQRIEKKFKTIF